jgi:hypothetical protein
MPHLPGSLLKKKDFKRCALVVFEAGLSLTVLLIGAKLDGGELSWGSAFTPLCMVEIPLFTLCFSQWLIKDCLDKFYDSVLPTGFTTRVNWLLPPFAVFQFLLMAQLDHKMSTGEWEFAWGTVLAPAFVFLIWSFLAATMCHSCCREEERQEDVETKSLAPAKGEGAERLEEEEEDGFRASEDDVQLDVMESNEVGEEDEEDRGHS